MVIKYFRICGETQNQETSSEKLGLWKASSLESQQLGKKQLGCYLPHQGQVGEHLGSQAGAGSIIVLRSDRNWPELC